MNKISLYSFFFFFKFYLNISLFKLNLWTQHTTQPHSTNHNSEEENPTDTRQENGLANRNEPCWRLQIRHPKITIQYHL